MNLEEFVKAVADAIEKSNVESRFDIHEIAVGVEAMRISTLIGEITPNGDTIYNEEDVFAAAEEMRWFDGKEML